MTMQSWPSNAEDAGKTYSQLKDENERLRKLADSKTAYHDVTNLLAANMEMNIQIEDYREALERFVSEARRHGDESDLVLEVKAVLSKHAKKKEA